MRFPPVPGTDGILPLPAGDEIAARQAYRGKTRGFQSFVKVRPHPLAVRRGVLRVIHAAVDHGADGLEKRPEEAWGDFPDLIIRMNGDSRLFHVFLRWFEGFVPFCIIQRIGRKRKRAFFFPNGFRAGPPRFSVFRGLPPALFGRKHAFSPVFGTNRSAAVANAREICYNRYEQHREV